MDPTANRIEAKRLAQELLRQIDRADSWSTVELDQHVVERLVELELAFVEWKVRGGFDPDWNAVQVA